MKFSNLGEVDSFIMFQREENANGKQVNIEELQAAKNWLQTKSHSAGKELERIADSILRSIDLDERSLPEHPSLELIRLFQLPNRSGVRSKNMVTGNTDMGDPLCFNQAVGSVPEIKKDIHLENLAFTAYLRLPVSSTEGIFIISMDVGLDSSKRPSRYERFLFQIPQEIKASEIYYFIQELINAVGPISVSNSLASGKKEVGVFQSIQDGLLLKHDEFKSFMQDLYSVLSAYGDLPSKHWFPKPAHVLFNPLVDSTQRSFKKVSELQELINVGHRLNYDFSNHVTFREAKQTEAMLRWFSTTSGQNGLENLVKEALNHQPSISVLTQILSHPQQYVPQKISTIGHLVALGVKKDISSPNVFSDWNFFQHDQAYAPDDIILSILNTQLPNSCGLTAFFHLEKFVSIESNEDLALVRNLKCWNKSVKQKLNDIHDRLNWKVISRQLESKRNELAGQKNRLELHLAVLGRYLGDENEIKSELSVLRDRLHEVKSEQIKKQERLDRFHKELKELKNPDKVTPFIRKEYKQVIANSYPPKLTRFFRMKEGHENRLQRRSKLRKDLITEIIKEQQSIDLKLGHLVHENRSIQSKSAKLSLRLANLKVDFVSKNAFEPESGKLKTFEEELQETEKELSKNEKSIHHYLLLESQ